MAGSRGLVLFADQLTDYAGLLGQATEMETRRARSAGLSALLHSMGAHAAAQNPDVLVAAHERLSCITNSSFRQDRAGACPVSGIPEHRYAYMGRPDVFVVILPPAKASTQGLGSTFTRSREAIFPPEVNFWRSALWHELSHQRMAMQSWQRHQILRRRVDEKEADLGMMAGCALAGDNFSGAFARAARSVSCLSSPINAKASAYWNLLALHGNKETTETDEISSMLEIKLRVRGYAPHTADAKVFAATAMGDANYMGLQRFYASPHLNTKNLLHTLQDVRAEGEWTFRHTARLARHITESGQRLGLIAI